METLWQVLFLLLVTNFEIFDFFFNFNTKVKGPGQNFLYTIKKNLYLKHNHFQVEICYNNEQLKGYFLGLFFKLNIFFTAMSE